MALRNDINAEVKADIVAYTSAVDGQGYLVYGDTARGDSNLRFYYYDSLSTAIVDGELVLDATGMGAGRFIKSFVHSAGAGININTSTGVVSSTVSAQKSYQGTSLRTSSFPFFKSATVASGVAVYQLTADGTATGTALFPNGVINESINAFVNDATASYQFSYVLSNSNKTLTVTANKLTTANILTGILGQSAANGSVVNITVYGY